MDVNFSRALALSAITGLAWIAYKHPKGYKKIFYVVCTLFSISFISAIISYIRALGVGIGQLNTELTNQANVSIPLIKNIADNMTETYDMVTRGTVVILALLGYMTFLYFLPNILEIKPSKEGEK